MIQKFTPANAASKGQKAVVDGTVKGGIGSDASVARAATALDVGDWMPLATFWGVSMDSGAPVSIACLPRTPDVVRKYEIAKKLRHLSLVNIVTTLEHGQWLLVISEYVSGQTLRDTVTNFGSLSEAIVRRYVDLRGLDFLHKQGVVRGNLSSRVAVIGSSDEACKLLSMMWHFVDVVKIKRARREARREQTLQRVAKVAALSDSATAVAPLGGVDRHRRRALRLPHAPIGTWKALEKRRGFPASRLFSMTPCWSACARRTYVRSVCSFWSFRRAVPCRPRKQ
jgi:hypothetical protein